MTQHSRLTLLHCGLMAFVLLMSPLRVVGKGTWQVHPSTVTLNGPESSVQILVLDRDAQGKTVDLTRRVKLQSINARVASVTAQGRIFAQGDGKTELRVQWKDRTVNVPVIVRGMSSPEPISFRQDVIPILSKAGCNSGGCHGKAEGQNGFKLSVFGSDPLADYHALVAEGRGRRVFFSAPERSLLLKKSLGQTGHGGGRKVQPGSLWHRRLARWIAEGGRLDQTSDREVLRISVEPDDVTLSQKASQQLRVTAVEKSGQVRDVTAEAEFQTNFDVVANVDENGLIHASDVPGGAAILVRYAGNVATTRVTVPQPGSGFRRPVEHNFVDRHVWDQLQKLNVTPSELADDATFLRRAYLDVIGTLPTAKEARAFLTDKRKDRRARLIDHLLTRDEYAQYQAMRWADLLHVDKDKITPQGAVAITRWLKTQFSQNVPYDRFVRSILTARGSTVAESPTSFFVAHKTPEEMGRSVSQIFLGVRIECAQCHHHPFDRWGQDDYFGFAGFFTGVASKGNKVRAQTGSDLKHPRTKEPVPTAGLGAEPVSLETGKDRRAALADWMTSPKNPFFARAIANRLWAHYFGRGLIDPIDDVRATNPATNEPLLNALGAHLIEVKYDLKAFTRTLLSSRVYQLSTRPNETNRLDEQNYSRAAWKPLPAEVLLDAVCQATGSAEHFNGWPKGSRAIQIWDNRMPSYFFKIFGRPARLTSCACERGAEPSIVQALHLMNAPETVSKIRHRDGRAATLARSRLTPDQIVEELYLTTLSRYPTEAEKKLMKQAFLEAETRREAVEDILWALLNTKEFTFNR